MTNDYKEQLLNYITGNITPGTQSDNAFKDTITNNNNLHTKLNDLNITPTFYKILSSDISSNVLVYGGYLNDDDNTYYGFIAILNSNGKVLDILTEYDSGTKFSFFQCLEYDEDNNIYGLDLVGSSYRFIMLNNVAIKTGTGFTCKLRQSYYIPSGANYSIPDSFIQGTSYVKKVNGKATYYLFGANASNVLLIEFKINVGSSNEWNYYVGSSLEGHSINFSDFIIENQNDTTTIYVYYVQRNIILYRDYFDGSSLTRQNTNTFNTDTITDIRALNNSECYVGVQEYISSTSYNYNIYLVDNGTSTLKETINTFENFYFMFNLINGLLFFKIAGAYIQTLPLKSMYFTRYGVYDGNNYILGETLSLEYPLGLIDFGCIVQKSFSLYKCYTQLYNTLYTFPIVIYDNQYSGGSYNDYNSLVPLHSELYSNGNIVFARSLYNKQIYQNTNVSIVNVPNNYLNDISIQPNNLIGTTMTTLVSSNDPITKNIYENVFVNFNNKIQVIDEDTNELYPLTASYINQNINTGTQTNYENTMISKIRINYGDSTNEIGNISWVDNSTYMETQFSIYVGKEIISIDFISDDETTTYISKTYDLTIGNIYTISQKLRVE